MNILYLHGWKGDLDENKLKILSKFGDNVYYPRINYQSSRNLIRHLCDEYGNKNLLVVGISLGAYFGFYVSNLSRVPALLFNPSFFFKNGGELRSIDRNSYNQNKKFILSGKDEEIDIKRTLKFLTSQEYNDIKIYDDLNHQIPLDVFEKEFSIFRENQYNLLNEKLKKDSVDEIKKDEPQWWLEVKKLV